MKTNKLIQKEYSEVEFLNLLGIDGTKYELDFLHQGSNVIVRLKEVE